MTPRRFPIASQADADRAVLDAEADADVPRYLRRPALDATSPLRPVVRPLPAAEGKQTTIATRVRDER